MQSIPSGHQHVQSSNEVTLSSNLITPTPGLDEQFQALFQTFPNLKPVLRDIYRSTLEPNNPKNLSNFTPQKRSNSGQGRGSSNLPTSSRSSVWTPEKGMKFGLSQLHRLQNDNSDVAEALNGLATMIDSHRGELFANESHAASFTSLRPS